MHCQPRPATLTEIHGFRGTTAANIEREGRGLGVPGGRCAGRGRPRNRRNRALLTNTCGAHPLTEYTSCDQ